MSFQFNSDREQIKAINPSLIGTEQLTIRSGSGSSEKEVLRAQLDSATSLPRVGINRTGRRLERIEVLTGGSGYTLQPTVNLSSPDLPDGKQALASAVISFGVVIAIVVDDPGDGYSTPPAISIIGGNGVGASARTFLDTVDFELDINGAIRTSTSIISDTARILNLDIDNFVTPDANFRGPNLKTFQNNSGTQWSAGIILQKDSYRYWNGNVYQALNTGLTGTLPPSHVDGVELNGEVNFKHIGFRVVDTNSPYFGETGESGLFPRSITPLLGDKSDKIATTEYVLNLATNDVGGRIYVSQQIGNDESDGRSAVSPVRTIKRAAQLAWQTPGVKETIIISGGDYVEDNPISLPPDASVVGDNLRLVLIRPANPRKHIFKFGDKNYVTGVTYRDQVDSNGDPVATWDFAMVFDDKQRIEYDVTANGDFGTSFPVGHQIFGPEKFRSAFQTNTGLDQLSPGQRVRGVNTGAIGLLTDVSFATITGPNAYINGSVDFSIISGSFNAGETFQYGGTGTVAFERNTAYTLGQIVWTGDYVYTVTVAGTSGNAAPAHTTGAAINGTVEFTFLRSAYEFISTDIRSIRAEGEVVFTNEDNTTALPIVRIDFALQGTPEIATGGFGDYGTPEDLGGLVFYTNALVGRQNTHNFKEGQEILISGLPTSSPDLSFLNGKQRIYKVLEDADGRCRRFVIPKKTTILTEANYQPPQNAAVRSASKSVTLTLLNSPNKFPVATPVARRYQDACLQIRNNIDFISDEVVRRINDEFKKEYFAVYGITANSFKIYLGPSRFPHTYVSGGTVTFNNTDYTITNFIYDHSLTGEATITTSSPVAGLEKDDIIKIAGIVVQCTIDGVVTQKTYPSFNIPVSDSKCRRDIGHFINALIRDLEYGSNYNIIEAAKKYISSGQIDLIDYEITQTIRAIEYARELAIYAMRKWRTGNGTPADPIYVPQYSSLTRYFDPTVIDDLASPACANVASAINTLSYLFVDVIANEASGTALDAAYLIARNRDFIADEALSAVKNEYPNLQFNTLSGEANRYQDAADLIELNKTEIQDRALAEISVEYNESLWGEDWIIPGDTIVQARARYFDAYRLVQKNRKEVIDRAAAEIAVQHPDFYYPGDSQSDTYSRFKDSYRLIQQNKTEIVDTAWSNMVAVYPGVSATETKCKRDIGYFVDALSLDVANGGNEYSRKFVLQYFQNGSPISYGLVGEETESIYAFNEARDLMKSAITNQLTVKDLTITADPATGSNVDPASCADVQTYIDTLTSIVTTVISEGNTNSLPTENLGSIPDGEAKCKRDIGFFIDAVSLDVFLDGNVYSRKFSQQYFDQLGSPISNGLVGEEAESITAFNKARDVMNLAITNQLYYKDLTITPDSGTGSNTDPASCSNVQTNITNLSSIITTVINDGDLTSLPSETVGTFYSGSSKCHRDIGYIVDAIANDLRAGGNSNIITATQSYFDGGAPLGNGVVGEEAQSIIAFNKARDLMQKAVTNQLYEKDLTISEGTPEFGDGGDIVPVGESGNAAACIDVQNTISTLIEILTVSLSSGNLLSLPEVNNGDFVESIFGEQKCRRDINFIITYLLRDLILGGNVGIVTAAEAYYTGTELTGIPEAQREETIYGFNQVRDLCILAMRNWKTLGGQGAVYTPLYSPIPLFIDNSILLDPNGVPLCAQIEASITTSFTLLENILDGTVSPGGTAVTFGDLLDTNQIITYPDSTIYDAKGTVLTIRSNFDDYPIIEASPYTQNASVISFLGGGGAEIDGGKVKQPNCPFPGLELDGSATFPNQGKSMVAAAFTIVSFGGTGYLIKNDGYVQLVSVFCIFCADGVLSESGGYASITNSATNFGIYALRAIGYNDFAYPFDVGTITNVSSTPTGRTIFTVDGLGREPLEHYVVKIDGYENVDTNIEYFIETVGAVTVGPPFSAQITIESGSGGGAEFREISTGQVVSTSSLTSETIRLHRPSIVNSSSHTWEFAGSGTNYNALPENGGVKIEANEQVSERYGRVYVSGTDELGDFKVGTFARIENRTGNITFTGTVTISEVEFLKLKGGDVVVTGFDNSNTLGGANSTDSKLPTQKAVRDYITNNLGPYINKPYSTNAVPRALVELTDSGKISLDQIPPLRPFSVYTVADVDARLNIEGALAGDIAIQQDTSTSFILNNDNASLFVSFAVNTTLDFTLNEVFTGSISGGKIQSTEYREGVVYQINITDPGSGYTTAPVITITGGDPQVGAIQAAATCTIANGQVVTVTIQEFNGFIGGKGYTTPPTVTFSAPSGAGNQATGVALIESRLYGDIVNNIKIAETDTIESNDSPPEIININRVVNTSASDVNNWVSLSTNQVAASDITSGVISTSRLANNSDAANSFTFLRGDQSYAPVLQSVKGAETRYFAKLFTQANSGSSQLIFLSNQNALVGHQVVADISGIQENTNINGVLTTGGTTTVSLNNALTDNIPVGTIIQFRRGSSPLIFESSFTQGNFIDSVVVTNGGTGFTDGQYFDVPLNGGTGTGLKVNIIVSGGTVTEVTVTNSGLNYNADFNVISAPTEIGNGSSLILSAKLSTVSRQYANASIDVQRVSDLTISADEFGTIGVSRFKKSQFEIGQAGNGSIVLKTGPDSGLDADLLDGAQGAFYLNASNLNSGTVSIDRLSGTYNISISGQSGNTLRLIANTSNPTSNPSPSGFSAGVIADTRNNTADGLSDGGTRHLTLTIRNGGSGFDTTFGGVRQLAFTDNDNLWIRGSGSTVDSFGSWGKIWSSLNDGPDTGLDADRLDNKQGTWYRNAQNINFGTLSDNRLPSFQTKKDFQDSLRILSFSGQPRYKILIDGDVLSGTPFLPGLPVNLYNADAQGVGTILISDIITNDDINDPFNNYSIISGVLTTGTFIGAESIGSASNRKNFQDFTLSDLDANSDGRPDGTLQVASLESSGGTALLKLGRRDGSSSEPSIYFNSSQLAAPLYNSAIIATGGNATNGSGTLDVKVVNANGFSVNNNTVWNSGNVVFNSANVASTATLKSAVIRDTSGNFTAGTITASLTGAASLNVLKTGDTMSGSLALSGTGSNLTVGGTLGVTGNTTLSGNLAVDSTVLFVDATNDSVGFGTASPATGVPIHIYRNLGGTNTGIPVMLRLETLRSDFVADPGGCSILFKNQDGNNSANEGYIQALTVNDTDFGDNDESNTSFVFRMTNAGALRDNVIFTGDGRVGINTMNPGTYELNVVGQTYLSDTLTVKTSISINDTTSNGAPILFLGSSSNRNFRIGNQLLANDVFEITPSTTNGGSTWKTTPALAIQGTNNRVAINTTSFGGTDPTDGTTQRTYQLNIQGDININGSVFQNNAEFVTSRWTAATNTTDIYRLSKVGINKTDPTYTLHVAGTANIEGLASSGSNTNVLYANADKQWLDSYGVFKANRNTVDENINIPANTNCVSAGPITISAGRTVNIANGATWSIV